MGSGVCWGTGDRDQCGFVERTQSAVCSSMLALVQQQGNEPWMCLQWCAPSRERYEPFRRPGELSAVCAIVQRMLWVCDGTRYSGSQCCLLTSCYKRPRTGWHLQCTPSPAGFAAGFSHAKRRREQCHGLRSPHRLPHHGPAPAAAERLPALWWSGRGFPPTCKVTPSLAPGDTAQLLRIHFEF